MIVKFENKKRTTPDIESHENLQYILDYIDRVVEECEMNGIYKYFDKGKEKVIEHLENIDCSDGTIDVLRTILKEFYGCLNYMEQEFIAYSSCKNEFMKRRVQVCYGMYEVYVEYLMDGILKITSDKNAKECPDDFTKKMVENTKHINFFEEVSDINALEQEWHECVKKMKDIGNYLESALVTMEYDKMLNVYAMLMYADTDILYGIERVD